MPLSILRVSQLNRFVKSLLDSDGRLAEVYVRGEIANLSVNARSGHLYFTLRDAESTLRAVLFSSNAAHLRFMPENGMSVIARGAATLYERDGAFQLVTSELMPDGIGTLGLAYEQLKRRLESEGLFELSRKRAIPSMPSVVGVVTSPTGAAIRDIVSVIERRCPFAKVLLAPAVVQGKEAARSIANGISALVADGRSEVLIVGRGGGSAEELWAFNEEPVVRAVAACPIPVISAVGHETDVTLCDFAADLRAATPTAAAELAVPDLAVLMQALAQRRQALTDAAFRMLEARQRRLDLLRHTPALENTAFFLDKNGQRLNNLIESMYNLLRETLARREEDIARRAALLESYSPLRVLARGYSVTCLDGHPLTDGEAVSLGDEITTILSGGTLRSIVTAAGKEK
ncbi:MAG: exodeoxyribonuclease VII large subunit [Oscillospiraceae bacterium]